MPEEFLVVSVEEHERIVCAAYSKRGFTPSEAEQAAKLATAATTHGIRTHNAIKAIHLDDLFGSAVGGCEALEICGGRGLRVFCGLAVVGKSEGLSTPTGARALFSPWIYALLSSFY